MKNNDNYHPKQFRKVKHILVASLLVACVVQLANLGFEYSHISKKYLIEASQNAEPEIIADQTNYAQMIKDTREYVREQDYARAATNLDLLMKSNKDKILLEVAKIRIRKDTPLYSHKIANEILLSLVKVEELRGEAAFLLARHHMNSLDYQTQTKAKDLLHRALEWRFDKAHAYLGDIYSKGIGTNKQLILALAHYEQAATAFSAAPIIAFARRIASMRAGEVDCGINPKRIVARHLPSLQTEARGDRVSAAKELGRIFYKGKLVERDIDEARKWLSVAAATGNAGAMRDLAMLELKFPTSDEAMDTAISLLEKSAKAGNASAYTSLGRIYLKEKTPEMEEKAIKAFETAARSGHKAAIKELAKINETINDNIGVDPIVTGSISSNATMPSIPPQKARISAEILNAAKFEDDGSLLCKKPDPENFNLIIDYIE